MIALLVHELETWKFAEGLDVPIPTLPLLIIRILSEPPVLKDKLSPTAPSDGKFELLLSLNWMNAPESPDSTLINSLVVAW